MICIGVLVSKLRGKVLDVIHMGHPTLSVPAKRVDDPTSPQIEVVVRDMMTTIESMGGGAGLAAPQVNIPLRIFIFCIPSDRGEDGIGLPLTPVINPVIEHKSDTMVLGWEGCFSLPGVMGEVPRHESITYQFQTLTGEVERRTVSGLHARIIQHETDHLEGVLYVERIRDMRRFGCIAEVKAHMLPKSCPD